MRYSVSPITQGHHLLYGYIMNVYIQPIQYEYAILMLSSINELDL